MSYAYTMRQGIVYFKRLNFMLCVLKKKMASPVCFPTGSSPRALEGLCWGDLSPFCRLLIDMLPRVRQTRHYEMFE